MQRTIYRGASLPTNASWLTLPTLLTTEYTFAIYIRELAGAVRRPRSPRVVRNPTCALSSSDHVIYSSETLTLRISKVTLRDPIRPLTTSPALCPRSSWAMGVEYEMRSSPPPITM